ncbi:hypothetical protein GGR53DRAFT_517251 [Hypoxylon sp. FL1150]|nr:hypothetical protein GGR53DRAFT_517251 [Hypoxylon sp. FL1150]
MPPLPYPLHGMMPASPTSASRSQKQQPQEPQSEKPRPQPAKNKYDWSKALTRKHVSTPEDPYAFLRHFDTAFLIDDSAAMGNYWSQVGALLDQIAPICTEHDRNGIDIYFVNHRPRGYLFHSLLGRGGDRAGYLHIGDVTGSPSMRDNVAGIFSGVRPRGRCRLGHRLSHILDAYLDEIRRELRRRHKVRPLNLIVITAGVTDDDPVDTLTRTARRLDEMGAPPYQVGVQFFRVGENEQARRALEFADDGLAEAMDFRDMVDTVTWSGRPGELSADALLKVVLGAVERSIDKQEVQ